jgi:hypothetical protein
MLGLFSKKQPLSFTKICLRAGKWVNRVELRQFSLLYQAERCGWGSPSANPDVSVLFGRHHLFKPWLDQLMGVHPLVVYLLVDQNCAALVANRPAPHDVLPKDAARELASWCHPFLYDVNSFSDLDRLAQSSEARALNQALNSAIVCALHPDQRPFPVPPNPFRVHPSFIN